MWKIAAIVTMCMMAGCPGPSAGHSGGNAGMDAAVPSPAAVVTPVTVCGHLAALGCPEGKDPDCATALAVVTAARVIPLNLACLFQAPTTQAVQACGGVACTP